MRIAEQQRRMPLEPAASNDVKVFFSKMVKVAPLLYRLSLIGDGKFIGVVSKSEF